MSQFPGVAQTVFTADTAKLEAPWGTESTWEETMWNSMDQPLFANNLAVNGAAFFSTVAAGSAQRNTHKPAAAAQQQPPTGRIAWASAAPASVLNIDPRPRNGADPFEDMSPHWPLDGHFAVVYNIAEDLTKKDNEPHLFTPLLTQQARFDALQQFRGKCLNCLEPDHSIKIALTISATSPIFSTLRSAPILSGGTAGRNA